MATGPLLGKADATLVQASTKAAMARVPKSMAPIHQRVMAARSAGMRAMGQGFAKLIEAAGKLGGKLIERNRVSTDPDTGSYSGQEAQYDQPQEQTSVAELSFDDDAKIKKFNNQINNLQGDLEYKDLSDDKKNEVDKLNKKIKNRTERLGKRAAVTFTHVDSEGGDVPVEMKTVKQQVKGIRKDIIRVRRLDKIPEDATNEDKELTLEAYKKQEIEKLQKIKNNVKESSVKFSIANNLLKEKINLGAIDNTASIYHDEEKYFFAHALLASTDNKTLDKNDPDIPEKYKGSRAIQAYDKNGMSVLLFVDRYGKQIKKDGEPITIDPTNADLLLVSEDPNIKQIIDNATNSKANRRDGKDGGDFAKERINAIDDAIKSKDQFKYASFYKSPDASASDSLANTLHGLITSDTGDADLKSTMLSDFIFGEIMKQTDPEIIKQFDIAGEDDKTKGDNKLTTEDFVISSGVDKKTAEKVVANYKELIEYILKGEDIELSKKILKTHLQITAQTDYNVGVGNRAEKRQENKINIREGLNLG